MCLLKCRNWFAGSSKKNGAPNAPVIQNSRAQHLLGQLFTSQCFLSKRHSCGLWKNGCLRRKPWKSALPPLCSHQPMWSVYGTAWKLVLCGGPRMLSELLSVHEWEPQTWNQIPALSLFLVSHLNSLNSGFLVCKEE